MEKMTAKKYVLKFKPLIDRSRDVVMRIVAIDYSPPMKREGVRVHSAVHVESRHYDAVGNNRWDECGSWFLSTPSTITPSTSDEPHWDNPKGKPWLGKVLYDYAKESGYEEKSNEQSDRG